MTTAGQELLKFLKDSKVLNCWDVLKNLYPKSGISQAAEMARATRPETWRPCSAVSSGRATLNINSACGTIDIDPYTH